MQAPQMPRLISWAEQQKKKRQRNEENVSEDG